MSRLTKVSIDSVLYEIGSKGINSYATLSELVNEKVSELYDGCIAWCNEELTYYQWLSTNEIISIYGRWRELEFGSDFQVDDPTVDAGDEKYKGKIIQYIGTDDITNGFKRGYFYESKMSNTINYVVAVVDATTAGTFYILEDDGITYTEVVLLGDGTNYDETKTYYKQQSVEVYTWKYVNIFDGYATDVKYANVNYPDLTNVSLAIDKILAKIYYVKPTCSLSASPAGGTFEQGTIISSPITFTWTVNKEIISQTLTDCAIELEDRTATYDTDITSDKVFTLSVSDGENNATSSVSYKFLNKIHFGNSVEPDAYDSAFILGLSNGKLASSNKSTYNFNCGDGEYAYFATPTSMKVTSAWVNGFQADLEEVASVDHTNASGYTTSYTVTRFRNASLGSFSAEVK